MRSGVIRPLVFWFPGVCGHCGADLICVVGPTTGVPGNGRPLCLVQTPKEFGRRSLYLSRRGWPRENGSMRPPCSFSFCPQLCWALGISEEETTLLTAPGLLACSQAALLQGQVPRVSPHPAPHGRALLCCLLPALPSLLHEPPKPAAAYIPQPGGAAYHHPEGPRLGKGPPSQPFREPASDILPQDRDRGGREGSVAAAASPGAWRGRGWFGQALLTSVLWLPCSAEPHSRGPPAAGLRRSAAVCRSLVSTRPHGGPRLRAPPRAWASPHPRLGLAVWGVWGSGEGQTGSRGPPTRLPPSLRASFGDQAELASP